jgi:hypothetical protein
MSSIILTRGDRGPAVAKLQRALNARGVQRGLGRLDVDSDLGPATWDYWERAYIALGGKPGTFDGGTVRALRRYRIIRFPGLRSPAELARAAKWKPAAASGNGVAAARAFYRRYVGRKESPPGSNRGAWGLSAWEASFGFSGVAWCGIALGKALQAAGVKGITSRVASVWLILQDGLAGTNGFDSCVYRRSTGRGSTSSIRPGDAVGIGGESTHVEWVDEVTPSGVWNYGGNTSSGDGSVSDGGMLARKFRPWSSVVYAVRPSYPKV